jgi:hypothetical protein
MRGLGDRLMKLIDERSGGFLARDDRKRTEDCVKRIENIRLHRFTGFGAQLLDGHVACDDQRRDVRPGRLPIRTGSPSCSPCLSGFAETQEARSLMHFACRRALVE